MSVLGVLAYKLLPSSICDQLWRKKNWRDYSPLFDKAIQDFIIKEGTTCDKDIKRYKKRLINAFVRDEWNPDEYFFFNYEHLSKKGRHEFVVNREAARFWNFMNTKESYLLTCDKGLTYHYFKPYYFRDLISIGPSADSVENFRSFVLNHSQFVVKPTFGNLGNGVRIIDIYDYSNTDSLISELLTTYPGGFVVEELITQHQELASFHPYSVNTVRLTTARKANGEVYIIHRPFLRLGKDGRCVDNGGNGGIICGIDYESGIVTSAMDENLQKYITHPNSGRVILGYQIPLWEEAKQLAVKLAQVLPELRYCGWDLALTDNGWVMVEANGKGLFIGFQMPSQEGFRDEFERMKVDCGFN